jgi:alpha 1,3-glucosidase
LINECQPEDAEDMWEAKFKGFTDKIRNGPTSIMFDVSFPGSAQVYGIPEHATSLALKRTKVRRVLLVDGKHLSSRSIWSDC